MRKKQVVRMGSRGMFLCNYESIIRYAFVKNLLFFWPEPDEEIEKALEILGQNKDNWKCAYCGGKYLNWNCLKSLIKNDKLTGYCWEMGNAVPACAKCIRSKKDTDWEDWINSDVPQSPRSRGITDLNGRITILKRYEKLYNRQPIQIEEIAGKELWDEYWDTLDEIIKKMRGTQKTTRKIFQKAYDSTLSMCQQ